MQKRGHRLAFLTIWIVIALIAGMRGVEAQAEATPIAGASCQVVVDDPDDPTLNVRSTPRGSKVAVLPNGTDVTILETRRDPKGRVWARIRGGWVNAFYLNCQAETLPPLNSTCHVNTGDPDDPTLNVRSEPLGTRVDILSQGAAVTIREFRKDASGRPWARIEGGWVYARFLECRQQQNDAEIPSVTPDVVPQQQLAREAPRAGAPISGHP